MTLVLQQYRLHQLTVHHISIASMSCADTSIIPYTKSIIPDTHSTIMPFTYSTHIHLYSIPYTEYFRCQFPLPKLSFTCPYTKSITHDTHSTIMPFTYSTHIHHYSIPYTEYFSCPFPLPKLSFTCPYTKSITHDTHSTIMPFTYSTHINHYHYFSYPFTLPKFWTTSICYWTTFKYTRRIHESIVFTTIC